MCDLSVLRKKRGSNPETLAEDLLVVNTSQGTVSLVKWSMEISCKAVSLKHGYLELDKMEAEAVIVR